VGLHHQLVPLFPFFLAIDFQTLPIVALTLKRKEENTYFCCDCMFNLSSLFPHCWTKIHHDQSFCHIRSSSQPRLSSSQFKSILLCSSATLYVLVLFALSMSNLLASVCLIGLSGCVHIFMSVIYDFIY